MVFRLFSHVLKISCDLLMGMTTTTARAAQSMVELSRSLGSYEKAIETLNSIQAHYASLAKEKIKSPDWQKHNFAKAVQFLEMGKVPVDELDKLAAIHVSGTKGKGSVCAFCESILRNNGYKTGFYSSPHLMEVRERIRINGKPMSKELFAHYFWEFLENYREERPKYATFMIFMAFYVFLKEKVDVAVIEVGLGGQYDATNVLRRPVVCGVTQLDKDHLYSLGGTVESIAWHKAGIFKPGVPAFTVPQDPISMRVLVKRAKERKARLKVVPSMSMCPADMLPALGIEGKHQGQNAVLAVNLCQAWLDYRKTGGNVALDLANFDSSIVSEDDEELPSTAEVFPLPESFREGLLRAYWPGRTQCIERENLTFYLDGAHTRKSVEACSVWFCEKSELERQRKSHKTIASVLIFNFKGDRDARSLLEPLVKCNFNYVVFCPNILTEEQLSTTSDMLNSSKNPELQKEKCFAIQETWREVLRDNIKSNVLPDVRTSLHNSRVFPCVADAVHWVVTDRDPSLACRKFDSPLPDVILRADHVQVFVTGSLFLVGMVMKVLGPKIVEI